MIWSVLENYLKRKIDDSTLNLATLLTLQQCFLNEFYISLQVRSINIQDFMNQPAVFEAYTQSAKSVDLFLAFVRKIIEVNEYYYVGKNLYESLDAYVNITSIPISMFFTRSGMPPVSNSINIDFPFDQKLDVSKYLEMLKKPEIAEGLPLLDRKSVV